MSRFYSTRPDLWNVPRRSLSECERKHHYGKLKPLQEPGLFARMFKDVRSR